MYSIIVNHSRLVAGVTDLSCSVSMQHEFILLKPLLDQQKSGWRMDAIGRLPKADKLVELTIKKSEFLKTNRAGSITSQLQ